MNNHKWNIYWLSNPKTVALSNTPDVSTSTQQLKKCEWSLKLHWLECTFLGCIYSNMHKSGFYIHFQMLHPRTLTNSSNFPGWGYTLIARWVSWLASPTIFRNIDAESVLRPSFVTGVKTRKSLIHRTDDVWRTRKIRLGLNYQEETKQDRNILSQLCFTWVEFFC